MLFTQKTYHNDPQSLLINVITMKLHHMTVRFILYAHMCMVSYVYILYLHCTVKYFNPLQRLYVWLSMPLPYCPHHVPVWTFQPLL